MKRAGQAAVGSASPWAAHGRMEMAARQLRSGKSRFPPCPALDKPAEVAAGQGSEAMQRADAVLAEGLHPDAAQGAQPYAGVQASGTVQPLSSSKATQKLAAALPRPAAAEEQRPKQNGKEDAVAVRALQHRRSGRLHPDAASPALGAQAVAAMSKPGAQSNAVRESAAPQAEQLVSPGGTASGAESPGGAHLLISGKRSVGLRPGQAGQQQKPAQGGAAQRTLPSSCNACQVILPALGSLHAQRIACLSSSTCAVWQSICSAPSLTTRHTKCYRMCEPLRMHPHHAQHRADCATPRRCTQVCARATLRSACPDRRHEVHGHVL